MVWLIISILAVYQSVSISIVITYERLLACCSYEVHSVYEASITEIIEMMFQW